MATVNLEAVVAGHKRRRAESSLTIMTAVLAKASPGSTSQPIGSAGRREAERPAEQL